MIWGARKGFNKGTGMLPRCVQFPQIHRQHDQPDLASSALSAEMQPSSHGTDGEPFTNRMLTGC